MPRRWHRAFVALLLLAAVAGAGLLLRSVLLERWLTTAAAAGLVVGAVAAIRGRTSGLWLALASAASIGAAAALGIAPGWFWIVAAAGVSPVAWSTPVFTRVDAPAAATLAALALAAGLASSAATAAGVPQRLAGAIESRPAPAPKVPSPPKLRVQATEPTRPCGLLSASLPR